MIIDFNEKTTTKVLVEEILKWWEKEKMRQMERMDREYPLPYDKPTFVTLAEMYSKDKKTTPNKKLKSNIQHIRRCYKDE